MMHHGGGLNKKKPKKLWYFVACSGLQINSAHKLKVSVYRQPLKESTEESNSLWTWDTFSCSEEEEKKTHKEVLRGQKRDEKTPYTLYSQSCQIQVIRIETPSGHLCPPPSFHRSVEKIEGRGGHRWSYGLSVWCLGRMSGTERGRAGCVRVKGKGVEKKSDVFISFLLCLVAAGAGFSDLTFSHTALTLKSVWKLLPRVDVRAKKTELKLSYKVTCVTCDWVKCTGALWILP